MIPSPVSRSVSPTTSDFLIKQGQKNRLSAYAGNLFFNSAPSTYRLPSYKPFPICHGIGKNDIKPANDLQAVFPHPFFTSHESTII